VGAELGSAHRSSANDGYAGALYIPLSHYTGLGIDCYTTLLLALYLHKTGRVIQRNPYSGARTTRHGRRHPLTMGKELLRVFEKISFRSLEACGQQWGIDPRTDDAGGGGGRRLCKSRRESFLSFSLLA
jgi:hypothetical protein